MEKSEMFQKREGTTDKGKDYENVAIANIIQHLISDASINNFFVSSNDKDFGAFDDIVIKLESEKGVEVIAMQLKHSDRKTLSAQHLKSKKGDFSISKYFESYQKINAVAHKFIIFTNRPFGVNCNSTFQLEGEDFYVKPVKLFDTTGNIEISKNVNYFYKFQIVEDDWTAQNFSTVEKYRTFFEKFYLYTNQENFDTLRRTTAEMFKETYSTNEKSFDDYFKIISEWNMHEGKKEKLNKKWMESAIALQILSSQIEPLSFGVVNEKMKIIRDSISLFDITILEENSSEKIKQLWGDVRENIDITELNRIRRNYQLSIDYINSNNMDNVEPKLFTELLWLMNKCPLIVRDNEKVQKAIKLCPDKKFILLGNDVSPEWLRNNYSVFQNLSDLRSKQECYEKIMENFTIFIQGKEAVTLMAVFEKNEEYLENVTTDNLMEMLNGPCYIDGKIETLAEPYIERYLSRNIINTDYLGNVRESTVIILNCANNFDKVKNKFRNYHLINTDALSNDNSENDENFCINENNFNTNLDELNGSKKMYISNSKFTESKLQKIYQENPSGNSFHYFKLLNNGQLEWIHSKGDISGIENYKVLENKYYMQETELWSSQLENNINVITSDPGMGKSELMKSLKNNCPPKFWTVIINPGDVNSFFKTHKLSGMSNYFNLFEKFIINEKCRSLKKLDLCLFQMCLKQNNIIYVWDALDEILTEHLKSVSAMIIHLSKKGFIQWVTSRRHLKTFLENKFNVLSLNITQFSEQEQQNYMKKRLETFNSAEEIETMVQKIKSTFVIIEHVDILGIPLQIFMITEIFRRNNDKYLQLLNNTFLLTDLYRSFIDEKFNIFYENKMGYDLQNAHQVSRINEEKEKILINYQALALKLIFPDFLIRGFNIDYEKAIQECSNNYYASIGFITEQKDNVTHFLHESFAEYLAARYFSNNFENIPWDIFFDQKYNNVRFFFDMLLAKPSPAHIAVLYRNFGLLKSYDDETLTRKDVGGRSVLHLICSWGQRHPRQQIRRERGRYVVEKAITFNGKPETNEFLEAVMHLLRKNNILENDSVLKTTSLLYARKSESLGAELILLQSNSEFYKTCNYADRIHVLYYSAMLGYDITKLFSYQKLNNFRAEVNFITKGNDNTALIIASKAGHERIVEYLVKSGAKINRANKNGETPLYLASRNGHEKTVEYLVKSGAKIKRARIDGRTPLYTACFNGHEKTVQYLVKSGAEINLVDNNGFTPLHLASQNGHKEIVQYLVNSGVEINRANNNGFTPLCAASLKGHKKIVEYLVKSGAEINRASNSGFTSLYAASLMGHKNIVEYLVKSGAEINRAKNDGFTPLHAVSYQGHEETVEYLVKSGVEVNRANNKGLTPLLVASFNGHEKIVEYLVKSGAEINRASNDGFTPLYGASQNGHEKTVEYLVKSGAEINRACNSGFIPLHAASFKGHNEIVEYLVKSGAEINRANNNGLTPLYEASFHGHKKTVEYLVKSGAEINRASNNGFTPLYVASQNGHEETVEYLVKLGAEINRASKSGFTPLDIASHKGHKKIVEFLVGSGAKNRSKKFQCNVM